MGIMCCVFLVLYQREIFLSNDEGVWEIARVPESKIYLHMAMVNSFVKGINSEYLSLFSLPLSPAFHKEPIMYPFLPAFYSATLIVSG